MFGATAEPFANPWRFQLHLEVWILIAAVIAAYIYAVRVIGPRALPKGAVVVSRKNTYAFVVGIGLLWFATDWPTHDIAEEYLYSVHMVQHFVLSYFVPPLALLATPTWLFRLIVGQGRVKRAVDWLARPVIAGVIYNLVVIISHIPDVVNRSVSNGPLHYAVHVLLIVSSLLMWMCVCGPDPEYRVGYMGKMLYLFLMSVVPTVPAAWLTFADDPVYRHYNTPVRVWGIDVISDQQAAGGIMKLGGAIFLWSIIIFIWFKRVFIGFDKNQSFRRSDTIPSAEITGHEDTPLTYEAVSQRFRESEPPVSPSGN